MKINVEVVFALTHQQIAVTLQVDDGCTVSDAIALAGIRQAHPEAALGLFGLGIWGREVPPTRILEDGDRVEIYRPLAADPKQLRREKALSRRIRRRPSGG
jgi:uncharacterized protein